MRCAVLLLFACGAATPPRPPTVVDPVAFLASLDPGKPIDVGIGGDGEESEHGKKRCAYWEWMSGTTLEYHSESSITLIDGDRTTTIDYRDLRANLAPDYQQGDVVEYCLEIGARYPARVEDQQYETPGPHGIAEHTHRVLHVGDAKDETPAYRGWSY